MRRNGEGGFTAMELMIVLVIFGLVAAASWPSIQSMLRQQRLVGATNQLVTHMRLAREKSVSEGNFYVVTFRPNSNDYLVMDDEGSDGNFDPPNDTRRNFPMPDQTLIMNPAFFGGNQVIFRPDGTANASGSVQIGNNEFSRQVNVLASTGKITVTSP